MLIEPIDERAAKVVLPQRIEQSPGLFAWGRPRLRASRLLVAWAEFLTVFIFIPWAAIVGEAITMIPLAIAMMLSCTAALLSMTRSFHWADLLPVDPLSEWRLALGCVAAFMVVAAGVTLAVAPERLLAPENDVYLMLLAFPLVTALPIELIYRALFFRRFGHLFQTEVNAVLVGAFSNGLVYYMLSHTLDGALFGAAIGCVLGWVYLRTGQFLLCVGLHWAAALALWIIGPGFGALL